jgi:2-(1,2-epoxy-1,2-dihydrophenyl)acetyl-CoA isomerase
MTILVKKDQINPEIAILTLNRPEKRNALNADLLNQLMEHLELLERNHQVKVVIIDAEGIDFCSGGDTSNMKRHLDVFKGNAWNISDNYKYSFQGLTKLLSELSFFTIAKLHGQSVGAGLGIGISCDFRIAADTAILRPGFLSIGLIPGDGSLWKLTKMIGPAKVNELLFIKQEITAKEAKSWGLVSEYCEQDQLAERTFDLANQLCKLGREVIHSYKISQRASVSMSLDDYLLLIRQLQSQLHFTDFHQKSLR